MPLGLKILNKVESIIRRNMNEYGCLEVLMPMVQPKSLWDETKRSEQMGPELLGFLDRNERDFTLDLLMKKSLPIYVVKNCKVIKICLKLFIKYKRNSEMKLDLDLG